MTAESDSCLEVPLSRLVSGSRCDGTELILVIGGGWGRESRFVWKRGCMGFCDFLGPSIIDEGPEAVVMSRNE